MAHSQDKRSSLGRKGKAWNHRIRETILCKSADGSFNLKIDGGAENGEFVVIGGIKENKVKYKRGKLLVDDIVLEINKQPVAGYTRPDVLTLINKDGGDAVSMRTVKPGHGIMRDLRQYLAFRFEKTTIDNGLQQTIRENLYRRTVPCTTRGPRPGEIPDVDYVFLNMDQFVQMERSGSLLESGIFDGNHYGTPKPPKIPVGTLTAGKRSGRPVSVSKMEIKRNENVPEYGHGYDDREGEFDGPLPPNWEIAYSEANEKYFINHETGTTQWIDPRFVTAKKIRPEEYDDDELPYGWERIDDPKYGTYYIDHESRKTQFENPMTASRRHDTNQNSYYEDPAPYRGPPSFNSAAAHAKAQEAEAHSRWPQADFDHNPQPPAYSASHGNLRKYTYNIDGRQLEGELIRTALLKGSRGFGFTIIGGDEPGELLQIKSIVADGAAFKDGKLRMGDALVRLNGRPVVSKTHQEVVSIFQTMPLNEEVEMEMIRGYPLPFDPDDPNIETIGSYTVVRSPNGGPESPHGYKNQGGLLQPGMRHGLPKSASDQSLTSSNASGMGRRQGGTGTFPRSSTTSSMPRNPPEIHDIRVVKGPMGFGFTIADSPYGQKVKQILDAPRCARLQEGDLLVEINNKQIRNYTHKEAVEMLQMCPKGREAVMVIQRGGYPIPLKNSPLTNRRQEELQSSGRKPRPKSTPPLGINQGQVYHDQSSNRAGSWGNLATSGESTRNQETGSSYRDSQTYPSLRTRRRSQEYSNGPYDDVTNVSLRKGDMGFGFRVVGGREEDTQVSIGTVVPGSPADVEGRLDRGDEIVHVNNESVIGASHHDVISMIHDSARTGRVSLGIRRRQSRSGRTTPIRRTSATNQVRVSSRSVGDLMEYGARNEERGFRPPQPSYGRDRRRSESDKNAPDVPVDYRDITLTRSETEGFGFVILSSVHQSGSTIGRIIQGSPADRCRELAVGDKLYAVNGKSIMGMHHSDIVDTIKQSGTSVTLTIEQQPLDNEETRMSHRSVPSVNRVNADGYISDREDYLRKHQREVFDRQREEEEAMERERIRREREELRIQDKMRREEELRREEDRRREDERREDARQREEERKREEEMREAERKEVELRRQDMLRREEDARREEQRKKVEEKRREEEKRIEDERRWAQERDEDRRWEDDRRRQSDARRFEEDRRLSGRFDAKSPQDERRRQEEFKRQDEIRKREQETRLQEDLRRRNEETQRKEEAARKQEDVHRRLEEEARRQEDRKREEELRRREEQQIQQITQQVVRSQPVKKAPPPILPKPSKNKVIQAREERLNTGYATLPARPQTAIQADRSRRHSGSESRPDPPTRTFHSRGKSESDLGRVFRGEEEEEILDVELFRKSQGYGFSIRGGRELNMSIFVLKIAEGGIADLDGRLKVGDEILEINKRSTKDLLHTDAIGMIRGGSRVKLSVRRFGVPPMFDNLPNGGPNRSLSRADYGRPARPMSNY